MYIQLDKRTCTHLWMYACLHHCILTGVCRQFLQHTNIRTSIYVGMYTSLYTYEHEHSYVYTYKCILHYILTCTHTHVYCTIQYCYVCIQHCVLTIKTHTHLHTYARVYSAVYMHMCGCVQRRIHKFRPTGRGGKDGAR